MLRMCSTVLLAIGPKNFKGKACWRKILPTKMIWWRPLPTNIKTGVQQISFPRKLSFQMSFTCVIFLQMHIPKLFSITNKLRSLRGGSQKRCGIELLKPRIADRLETCELHACQSLLATLAWRLQWFRGTCCCFCRLQSRRTRFWKTGALSSSIVDL